MIGVSNSLFEKAFLFFAKIEFDTPIALEASGPLSGKARKRFCLEKTMVFACFH